MMPPTSPLPKRSMLRCSHVIDVSPLPFVAAPPGEMGELAHRLWRLQRQQVASRFRAMGVPVSEWRHGRPVDEVLAELQGVRRYARTVRI